jgi:hypothetical protein
MDFMSGLVTKRRQELESRPVTEVDNPPDSGLGVAKALEVSQQAAREEHARHKAADPGYASAVNYAAQKFAKKDTAEKAASKRLSTTTRNVNRDPLAVAPQETVTKEPVPEGFQVARQESKILHPTMGPDEIQGHVFEHPPQQRAVHSLLQGIAAGRLEGPAHFRDAEQTLGVQYPESTPPYGGSIPALTHEQVRSVTGLGDVVKTFDADPEIQERSRQARIHGQMGQIPMYRGLIQNPQSIASAASAVGGRGETVQDMAESIGNQMTSNPPDPMRNSVGIPHSEFIDNARPRADIVDPMRDAARSDIIDHVRRHAQGTNLLGPEYAEGAHASLEGPLATAQNMTVARSTPQTTLTNRTKKKGRKR